jgi:hypothetical protein
LVVIEVDASSKEKAEEVMDKITIDISESSNSVSFETDIDFDGKWSKKVDFDIKYTVKLPSYLNVTASNKYGNMYIQELAGLAILDLQYGNLKINKLLRGNDKPYNSLELAYSNADIEEAGWLELEIGYGDFEVSNAEMLFVESQYAKLSGEYAGSIITEGKYDKYIFDEVTNFVAELKYSGIKFGKLNKKIDVNASYTNVKLENISKGFESVKADLSYGNLYMGTEAGTAFSLKAEAKYGGIDVGLDGDLSKSKENSYVKVWGTVGSGAKGEVEAITRYGNISID